MNFYSNFVKLCNSVGKSPSRVVLEIGGTKSAITRWKNGSSPTDATAMKIAEYFGVSVEELTGETKLGEALYESARDNGLVESPFKKQEKPTATKGDGLYEIMNQGQLDRMKNSQIKLIEIAKKLPEEEVELLLRQAELLIHMMESKNGDAHK